MLLLLKYDTKPTSPSVLCVLFHRGTSRLTDSCVLVVMKGCTVNTEEYLTVNAIVAKGVFTNRFLGSVFLRGS